MGHVLCCRSHGVRHAAWKRWPQGMQVTRQPSSRSSVQIAQAGCGSGAPGDSGVTLDFAPELAWAHANVGSAAAAQVADHAG
jgi:hypothetical protein